MTALLSWTQRGKQDLWERINLNPIRIEWVPIWQPTAIFSLFFRHGFCSKSDDGKQIGLRNGIRKSHITMLHLPKSFKFESKLRHIVGKWESKGLKQPATHFCILSAIVSCHKTKSKFVPLCITLWHLLLAVADLRRRPKEAMAPPEGGNSN